ncbi:DUF3558 family protein [Gordonia jinhuaensis]|uniref:DUF3558 family protein n=1 Tax=Gordonia jinhuaensis TaxID=1517702 RepID=UPI00227A46DE|nr:DUF3558 family protein [Gordonia jinhuaensis]
MALLVGGCSSSTGGTASSGVTGAGTTTVSASASPQLSEDDPLNVNSTKDLSTVTATIEGAHSPYLYRLPNICPRFPDSALIKAGIDPSLGRNPFSGKTTSLLQNCGFSAADPTGRNFQSWGVSPAITSINIKELIDQPRTHVVESNLPIGPHSAFVYHSDGDTALDCEVAWGTFFGAVMFQFTGEDWYPVDACAKTVDIARALYPYFPSRPSEMR